MTLQEIDNRLDLLPEYLAYRAEWIIRWKGHLSTHTYYLDEIGVIPLFSDDYPYGYILNFEDWIKIRDKYTALVFKAIGA